MITHRIWLVSGSYGTESFVKLAYSYGQQYSYHPGSRTRPCTVPMIYSNYRALQIAKSLRIVPMMRRIDLGYMTRQRGYDLQVLVPYVIIRSHGGVPPGPSAQGASMDASQGRRDASMTAEQTLQMRRTRILALAL